jgi:hypothetical protein
MSGKLISFDNAEQIRLEAVQFVITGFHGTGSFLLITNQSANTTAHFWTHIESS